MLSRVLSFLFCLSVGLSLLACGAEETDRGSSAQLKAALDFETGDVAGVVSWNGQAVSGLAGSGIRVAIDGVTAGDVASDGSFLLQNVPPGDYQLSVHSPGCSSLPAEQLGSFPVSVDVMETTAANLDITATAGLVVGNITVNGVPVDRPAIAIEGFCGSSPWSSDSAGEFAHFAAPGSYSARVWAGAQLGTFAFASQAGETTDLGAVEFSTGGVAGVVSWNGQALSGLAGAGVQVAIDGVTMSEVASDGSFVLGNVPPGNYELSVYSPGCSSLPAEELGTFPVTVAAMDTTAANLDITATAGLVVGNVTVNGVPVDRPAIAIEGFCGSSPWSSNSAGEFAHFAAPGSYSARVWAGAQLGTFAFTSQAGETTDLGAVEFSTGGVAGVVSWNGQALSGLAGAGVQVAIDGVTMSEVASDGSFVLGNVPPGNYELSVYSPGCSSLPAEELGTFPVTVVAMDTTAANLDITATAGLVVGKITINGEPVDRPGVAIEGFCGSSPWSSNSAGEFAHYAAPGSYSARVWANASNVGTFAFTTLAGRTTDVDIGSTPEGTNVAIDLSGGIGSVGGISLLFSSITGSGSTTVVESGAGAPPPSGYRIVGTSGGPVYWDIDTSATYAGPITVCIHYDPDDVQGNESNLQLRHDGGSGWEDITTSIDTAADVICGQTNSLSPFAVMESSITVSDSDFDGVEDSLDECPATGSDEVVDEGGCSLSQLVPCSGAWKNHGAYVKAFVATARAFRNAGLIDAAEQERLVSAAASSNCGK